MLQLLTDDISDLFLHMVVGAVSTLGACPWAACPFSSTGTYSRANTQVFERCRKQCPGRTMRVGGRLGGCEEQDCGLQQQACQAERSRCPSGLHLAWAFTAGWLQPGDRACVQARLELRATRSRRQGWCDSRLCAEWPRLQSVLGCNPGNIAAYSCEKGVYVCRQVVRE